MQLGCPLNSVLIASFWIIAMVHRATLLFFDTFANGTGSCFCLCFQLFCLLDLEQGKHSLSPIPNPPLGNHPTLYPTVIFHTLFHYKDKFFPLSGTLAFLLTIQFPFSCFRSHLRGLFFRSSPGHVLKASHTYHSHRTQSSLPWVIVYQFVCLWLKK